MRTFRTWRSDLFNGTLKELIYLQKVNSLTILSPSLPLRQTRYLHSKAFHLAGKEEVGTVNWESHFSHSLAKLRSVISGLDQPFPSPKLQNSRLFHSLSVLRLTSFSGRRVAGLSIQLLRGQFCQHCLFWPVSVDLQVETPGKQSFTKISLLFSTDIVFYF